MDALRSDHLVAVLLGMRGLHDLLDASNTARVSPHRVDQRERVADHQQHRHPDRDVARHLPCRIGVRASDTPPGSRVRSPR